MSRRHALAFLFVFCVTVVSALSVAASVHPEPFGFDRTAYGVGSDAAPVARWISAAGSSSWIAVELAVVGAAFLVFRRDPRPGIWLLLAFGGSALLYNGLKAVVDRPRPPVTLAEASGLSFPSGHATAGVAFYGMLAAILLAALPRGWRVPTAAAALAFGIASGLSRIVLGVHWATDVVAGFALGGAWLAALLLLRPGPTRDREASSPAPG